MYASVPPPNSYYGTRFNAPPVKRAPCRTWSRQAAGPGRRRGAAGRCRRKLLRRGESCWCSLAEPWQLHFRMYTGPPEVQATAPPMPSRPSMHAPSPPNKNRRQALPTVSVLHPFPATKARHAPLPQTRCAALADLFAREAACCPAAQPVASDRPIPPRSAPALERGQGGHSNAPHAGWAAVPRAPDAASRTP